MRSRWKAYNGVRNVRRYGRCFFLLGGSVSPADICKRLCEYGMDDIRVHIGARLAYPDEQIASGTARELSDMQCDPLCAVITENPSPEMRSIVRVQISSVSLK